MTYLTVHTIKDTDRLMAKVREAAKCAKSSILAKTGDPLELLRLMKFEQIGFHPISHGPLNFIEQINQTWTFMAAIAAARRLLVLYPDAGGFRLAPGAHARLPLDIMSEMDGLIGAETFAAVSPHNNNKLKRDLEKLARFPNIKHRYVFFLSPQYPGNEQRLKFEFDGIQVWWRMPSEPIGADGWQRVDV